MSLFDSYVMVDWSANATPKRGRDSIWWSDGRRASNPPTREQASAELRALLLEAVASNRRVLVGFDFPFSFPRGFARALRLRGTPWKAVWKQLSETISDDQRRGANNRFEVAAALNRRLGGPGPFWGCPVGRSFEGLGPRGVSSEPLPELKLSERCVVGPQSPWKLYGAGSVGSQALLGIPRLHQLRTDPGLRSSIRVWPFETGFRRGDAPIVFAEVYPSLVPVVPRREQVRDEAQVRNLARWFRARDAAGSLEGLLRIPAWLAADDRKAVREEEGWVLGVMNTTPLRPAAG